MSALEVEILQGAREFLSDGSHWLRDGEYGRHANGSVAHGDATSMAGAARCCMIGACIRAGWDGNNENADPHALLKIAVKEVRPSSYVIKFNDIEATHAEMLAAFDRAIELAGES